MSLDASPAHLVLSWVLFPISNALFVCLFVDEISQRKCHFKQVFHLLCCIYSRGVGFLLASENPGRVYRA